MFLFKKNKVGGDIKFFSLEDWWFSTFTKEEREYIDNKYVPMGAREHTLTQGNFSTNQNKSSFLFGLSTWFRKKEDSEIRKKILTKMDEVSKKEPIDKPGYYGGRHYSTYVPEITILKREERNEELEFLLLKLVDATETQDIAEGYGVAPFYYEELAILYRKQKEPAKEIAILDRFMNKMHGNEVTPAKLVKRLEKAKELLAKK